MLLVELAPHIIEAGIKRDELLANRIIWELSEAMKKKGPQPQSPIYPDR